MLEAIKTNTSITLGKLGDEDSKWVLKVSHDGCSATLSLYRSEHDSKADEIPLMECNVLIDDDDVAHATFTDPRYTNGGEVLFVDSLSSTTTGALVARVRRTLSVYILPDSKCAILEERAGNPRILDVPEFNPSAFTQAPDQAAKNEPGAQLLSGS